MSQTVSEKLKQFYHALLDRYGPQSWWPASTAVEMIVGAILTQNTSWKNVEQALARLKAALPGGALTAAAVHALSHDRLAELIRPAGYFNIKARRLKNLVAWMVEVYGGDVERMKAVRPVEMRRQLLEVNGVGPETADSIVLYALGHPRFVVDAYTYRVAVRHGLVSPGQAIDYDELQALFQDHLESDAALFNEFHALLVRVAKEHCKSGRRVVCEGCPLERFPHDPTAGESGAD